MGVFILDWKSNFDNFVNLWVLKQWFFFQEIINESLIVSEFFHMFFQYDFLKPAFVNWRICVEKNVKVKFFYAWAMNYSFAFNWLSNPNILKTFNANIMRKNILIFCFWIALFQNLKRNIITFFMNFWITVGAFVKV
jgi:hypothetical protein